MRCTLTLERGQSPGHAERSQGFVSPSRLLIKVQFHRKMDLMEDVERAGDHRG